jgi:hypothetical protein
VGSGNDYAGVGEVGTFGCGNVGQYWIMNGSPQIVRQFANSANSPNQYFTIKNGDGSAIFATPPGGTFNLQNGIRNTIYGPGFQDWNLGLFKRFVVSERTGFELRGESFDILNHPNWGAVNYNPTSSTFGKVTSKTSLTRTIQLSLYLFTASDLACLGKPVGAWQRLAL